MTQQERLPEASALPAYFHPERATGIAHEQLTGLPANVIDAFYVQSSADGATDMVYVVGMRDGTVKAVINAPEQDEDTLIRDQMRSLQVSQRETFRGIRAQNLSLLSVTHIELGPATQGLNDPVNIHGMLNSTIRTGLQEAQAVPLQANGVLTVGRLDLLRAYREGTAHAFQSLSEHGVRSFMIPLHVPAGPVPAVEQGKDIALAYTMFSPAVFEQADNSYLTLSLAYDLLTSLKEDMKACGIRGMLTDVDIPVPNRALLEAELRNEGYRIEGNQAVQADEAVHGEGGLLKRLRQMAAEWSAERIELPREATHHDYLYLIDRTLEDVSTSEDIAMARTLGGAVTSRMKPIARNLQKHEPAPRALTAVPQQNETIAGGERHAAAPDYSEDFLVERVPTRGVEDAARYDDFIIHSGVGRAALNLTAVDTPSFGDGHTSDFEDFPSALPVLLAPDKAAQLTGNVINASSGNIPDRQPEAYEWADDFTAKSQPRTNKKDDYSGDFS